MRLELFAPLRAGMLVKMFEMDNDGGGEAAEIYLCYEGPLDLSRCRSAGQVVGSGTVTLSADE